MGGWGGGMKSWIHRSNGITCRRLGVAWVRWGKTLGKGGSKIKTGWKLSTGYGGWGGGLLCALAGWWWRRWLDTIKMFLMLVAEESVDGRGKGARGRPCVKADVRRVQRNRRVWSHLMGKGNIYEAGTNTHQATRRGPVTDPSKKPQN